MKLLIDAPMEKSAVDLIQKKTNSLFIGDLSVKVGKDMEWTDYPVMVFYQPYPNLFLGHSHVFGAKVHDEDVISTMDIGNTLDSIWNGILDEETGLTHISRFRHDFRQVFDGSFIDGGQAYTRSSGNYEIMCHAKIPFMKFAHARRTGKEFVEVD